jgi:hypothetical protein
MKTIRNIILILAVISFSTVSAQRKRPVRDRVDAMKVGFLTDRLNLTSEEAQAFWPVYNQYSDELEQLRKDRRENIINAREHFDSMSPAELEKAVDNEIIFRQNELEIVKKYHPQFKKVLPIKKVALLYRAEEEFKRHLLEMIREKRDGDGPDDDRRPMKMR